MVRSEIVTVMSPRVRNKTKQTKNKLFLDSAGFASTLQKATEHIKLRVKAGYAN